MEVASALHRSPRRSEEGQKKVRFPGTGTDCGESVALRVTGTEMTRAVTAQPISPVLVFFFNGLLLGGH